MPLAPTADSRDLDTRASSLVSGDAVQVEASGGATWSGRITNSSDQLIGIRGAASADGLFRARERVTLHCGSDDGLVSFRAQVLSVSGWLLRVVRRDSSVEDDRRRAPRLSVRFDVDVAVGDDEIRSWQTAEMLDLSSAGCALRCAARLPVGHAIRIVIPLSVGKIEVGGLVVRTWTKLGVVGPMTGVQFEQLSRGDTVALNRFLVDQLDAM